MCVSDAMISASIKLQCASLRSYRPNISLTPIQKIRDLSVSFSDIKKNASYYYTARRDLQEYEVLFTLAGKWTEISSHGFLPNKCWHFKEVDDCKNIIIQPRIKPAVWMLLGPGGNSSRKAEVHAERS